jgi:hypothetical protein
MTEEEFIHEMLHHKKFKKNTFSLEINHEFLGAFAKL